MDFLVWENFVKVWENEKYDKTVEVSDCSHIFKLLFINKLDDPLAGGENDHESRRQGIVLDDVWSVGHQISLGISFWKQNLQIR